MNHTTNLLEHVYQVQMPMLKEKHVGQLDLRTLSCIADKLAASKKFLLPPNGDVGCEAVKARDASLVRLPYPSIVFEYSVDSKATSEGRYSSSKRVVLILDGKNVKDFMAKTNSYVRFKDFDMTLLDNPRVIHVVTFGKEDSSGMWDPAYMLVTINLDNFFQIADEGQVQTWCLMPDTTRLLAAAHTLSEDDDIMSILLGDAAHGIQTAMNALTCLNARNVTAVSVPPPKFANKQRFLKQKPLFFEYHVLDIFLTPEIRKMVRTDPLKARNILDSQLKASVALHTVRGHFKRRKTGLFWWSPFARGSKDIGVVDKDYALKTKE